MWRGRELAPSRSWIAGAIVCLVLAAAPVRAAPEGAAPCLAQDAVPNAVRDAPFLVLGEVHGTREVPAFVAGYLCAAAQAQRKITLAVEYPVGEQDVLDAFFSGAGTSQDVARLKASQFWRRPQQDGRTSSDMLRLFERIRLLRAGGADIRVVAIDAEEPPARRSGAMANNLRIALDAAQGRQLVALVGALHATRTRGTRFNPNHASAIHLLSDRRPLALTVGTGGGQAWICRGPTPAGCGPTDWDINRVTPAPPAPFSLTPPSPQFDGVFYVGATTASPPAIAASE